MLNIIEHFFIPIQSFGIEHTVTSIPRIRVSLVAIAVPLAVVSVPVAVHVEQT